MKTAFIEREHLGGTCVNDGCIPTKALVASAHAAHIARRHADFGIVIDGVIKADMKAIKARKDQVVAHSISGLTQWLSGMKNLTQFRGHGRFEDAHAVSVNGEVLEADRIFINVGGRPSVPDWPALKQIPYLTNVEMMQVDFLPEHLVVIGGSYIGLEFAQMYRRFGSRVTVVEKANSLIAREDQDVSDEICAILEREGIEVRTNAECLDVERRGDRFAVGTSCAEGPAEVTGSHLLLAMGRKPNTENLGLDKAGIAIDSRGYIIVDETLATNVPGVWALGDVNGRGAFTHTSWNDYEIVAANLFDGDNRRVSDRIETYALFTDPPLGRAGKTERQVRESGRPALIGKMPMTRVGRARERSETQGFMKVLVDAGSKKIVGAALLGIEADEIVHSLLDVMYADAPYTLIERAMHIHPTVTELIPTLLGQLKPLQAAVAGD